MELLSPSFLFRVTHPCRYRKRIPDESGKRLLNLPAAYRLDNFAEMAKRKNFAELRIAWNEGGLGIQLEVRGKEQLPQGDASRPNSSDGLMVWVDTRDTRNIHRASRYCHQFYFLPTGGGSEGDEPAAGQLAINRAQQDAPPVGPDQLLFQAERTKTGYELEVFLPATALHGFDPETNPRLGFFYWVRDAEQGEQTLGVGPDFPFWEDPSLWSTLELVKEA